MSKNLTRKGLALGTAIAFGTTLFTGVPAMAAPSLSLVPAYGSGYATLNNHYDTDGDSLSNIFVLKSNFVDAPDGKEVVYKVENAGEANIWAESADNFDSAVDSVYDDNADVYDDSDSFYITQDPSTSGTAYLALATNTVDEDVTIKVTAFYDVTPNGELDSEEGAADVVSATRTITFYTPENAKAQVNLIQPNWDDTSLVAQVTFSASGVNTRMIGEVQSEVIDYSGDDAQVWVEFRDRAPGSAWTDWGAGDWDYVYWDTSDDELGLIADVSYTVDSEVRLAARAGLWDEEANDTVYSPVSYRSVTEPTASYVELEAVTGANVTDNAYYGGAEYAVRAETKSVSFEATAYDNDDDEVAGVPVTITITNNDLQSGSIITAGGKTLRSTGDDISFTVNTDSNGVAKFTVTSNNGEEDDYINVDASIDDVDGGSDSTNVDVAWEVAQVDDFVETSSIDYDGSTSRAIVKGGSFTLTYLVLDQFNEPTSSDDGDDLRVAITDDSADYDVDKSKAVVNGKVSFTVTDDSDDIVTDYTVTGDLYADYGSSLSASLESWDTEIFVNEQSRAAEFFDISVWGNGSGASDATDMDPADLADSDVYDTADVYSDVTYEDFATGNHWEDVDFGTLSDKGDNADIGLYVADSNGDVQPGAVVTVSAPGLLIQDYEYEYQASLGTYSAPADDAAWFEFNLYSHKSGLFPVTITSGSAKISFLVAFNVDTADVDADDVTLSLSKTPLWGKDSIDVKAVVGDKFGNGIEGETVDFSKSGFGFLDETSADTDANGIARVTLVGGTSGTTTISAVSDDTFDKETATKTVFWWNKTASATEGATAGKVLVYGSAAVGDKVVVKVDGKRVAAFNTTTKRFSYTVKGASAGTRAVVVKINGKKVFHDLLTVK